MMREGTMTKDLHVPKLGDDRDPADKANADKADYVDGYGRPPPAHPRQAGSDSQSWRAPEGAMQCRNNVA
jgi:hypothetical protein